MERDRGEKELTGRLREDYVVLERPPRGRVLASVKDTEALD